MKRLIHIILVAFVFCLCILTSPAMAGSAIILEKDNESYPVGLYLEILNDPNGGLNIEQVSAPQMMDRFRRSKSRVPNFGFQSSIHWLRFDVVNNAPDSIKWVLELQAPTIDYVDLFTKDSAEGFRRSSSGDAIPMNKWEIQHRNPSFYLELKPGQKRTYYMRLESSGLIRPRLTIYSKSAFEENNFKSSVLFVLFIGGAGIIILYNLMFLFTLRERIYLYYALSTLFIGLFISSFTGFSFQYLWPYWTKWASVSLMVFTGMMLFWTALFTREFLDSRNLAPYMDYVAMASAVIGLAVCVLSPIAHRASIALSLIGLTVSTVIYFSIAVKSLMARNRYALYYLSSYLIFFIGLLHGLAAMVGIIEVTGRGISGMTIGLPFTVLVLALAMADRFTAIQKEYSHALEAQVALRTKELNKALEDLAKSHDELESRVFDRTKELAEANESLRDEIDERIKAERKLEEAHFKLEERTRECEISEERFKGIFETTEDYIFLKDTNLKFTHLNPAMLQILGMTREQALAKTASDFFGQEYTDTARNFENKALSGEIVETEYRVKVRGWPMTLNIKMFPIKDKVGAVKGICAMARDISGRRRSEELAKYEPGETITSQVMGETLQHIRSAAQSDTTVLFLGESGVGKDHWAKRLHDMSHRSGGPYFSINCAALPIELAESELFGHEAGSFTGAKQRKRGLLELAEGGTALLNEIGDIETSLQAKLLTFFDNNTITRVGGQRAIRLDVRILAATNRDLSKDIEKGIFREDLFHRLNVLAISIPPLRERREDIPLLAQEILDKICARMLGSNIPELAPEAKEALLRYDWPGNIRELRNVLERAIILRNGETITIDDLRLSEKRKMTTARDPEQGHVVVFSDKSNYQKEIDLAKRYLVMKALEKAGWNVTLAAKHLGLSRGSMLHHMRQLEIKRP